MSLIECPRCDEGDERSEGLNVCGLCECRFTVRHGRIVPTIVNVGDELHQVLADALDRAHTVNAEAESKEG